MSTQPISWFHCGRCGSLFHAPMGESETRACSTCGANPSLGIAVPTKPSSTAPAAVSLEPTERSGDRKRVKVRKPVRKLFMTKLILGWSLFFILLIGATRLIWHDNPESSTAAEATAEPVSSDDSEILEKALQACNETLFKFLSTSAPEERNQFVWDPLSNNSRMFHYNSTHVMEAINPQELVFKAGAVVRLPSRKVVETQWTQAGGKSLDAVFVEENGEWHLDWEHFVRYSDQPLGSFLAGNGNPDGEFRVLAREPLADEREGSPTITIVLYEPHIGDPLELGRQSPEFSVPRDSSDGMLLEAAFKREKSGKRPYDSKLPRIDPKDFVRLRVKLHRDKTADGDAFKIVEILADHWYGAAGPANAPPPQK